MQSTFVNTLLGGGTTGGFGAAPGLAQSAAAAQQPLGRQVAERPQVALDRQLINQLAQRSPQLAEQIQLAEAAGISPFKIPNPPNFNDLILGATLGETVQRQQDVGPDLAGKMMGYGTFANAGRYIFTSKESVLLTPDWASVLTGKLSRYVNSLNGQNGENASDPLLNPNFSLGIYGSTTRDGRKGFYCPSLRQYYADDRARITISSLRRQDGSLDDDIEPYLLPGSTPSRAALALGYAIGLSYVKNPNNRTGYVRVGSKGWRDLFARWNNNYMQAADVDMEHLFGQGAAYGFGPIYDSHRIDIAPVTNDDPNYPVRFRVNTNNGGRSLRDIVSSSTFMRQVQTYYDRYFKNPDQERLGRYGAASLLLRHADKMTTGSTGQQQTQEGMRQLNQAVVDAFRNNGSVKGVARWGRGINDPNTNYASFRNRFGLTANPLRTRNGAPVDRRLATDKTAGFCNIYGSGVGVSQRASLGGEYGNRFYIQSRKHLSKRNGIQGQEIGDPTYFCGPTPDFVINPDRDIYRSAREGGLRGAEDRSLAEVVDAFGQASGTDFSAQDLRYKYADWALNPERYGTAKDFMLDRSTGRLGWTKAAPGMYAANMSPQEAAAYQNTDITINRKILRSNALANELVGGGIPQQGKASYPTSGYSKEQAYNIGGAARRAQGPFQVTPPNFARPAPAAANRPAPSAFPNQANLNTNIFTGVGSTR